MTTVTLDPTIDIQTVPPVDQPVRRPARVVAHGVGWSTDEETVLRPVDLEVAPGEIVGIAGGSGAGKTTLLELLAGVRRATTGTVRIDGVDGCGAEVGFVPQDDIIHLDLPLRRTLELAAELRMPGDATSAARGAAVDDVLRRLDLTHRAGVKVRSLSGGQRKRASIAVELLTDPGVFFLDEPTSGLDPATSAAVMDQLRSLADTGTAVVVTTHSLADLDRCDRVAFMAVGGRLAFVGTAAEAMEHFGVASPADLYALLARPDAVPPQPVRTAPDAVPAAPTPPRRVGRGRQWRALTRRTIDLLVRNPLTLAILVGSPVGVVGMLAVLFPAGAFDAGQAGVLSAVQALFWITFSSFFFGVTYGLLQVVGEVEVLRRERLSGLSLTAYVASKLTVLAPLLVAVNALMLGVLRALDRLPASPTVEWLALLGAASSISIAGVTMGLLASSLVHNPAQATLALPMLCFPQVLFAGAAIAVSDMAVAGRIMSYGMANRWGFESMGRTLDLADPITADSPAAGFVDTFTGSALTGVAVLAAIAVAMAWATHRALDRRLATA